MRTRSLALLLAGPLLALAAGIVLAAPTPASRTNPPVPPADAHPAQATVPATHTAPVNPLMPQIDALLAQERQQLADLTAQLRQAAGTDRVPELQRRIAEVKKGTERSILELQLAHARETGNTAAVQSLERSLAALDAPPPAPRPVERAIPSPRHQR